LRDIPSEFNLDHRSQLLRIVAVVLSVEFKEAQRQRIGFVRAEEHMVQVLKGLSAAELLSLSVGELATKFSVSRRHLNRLFHHHYGISVSALRMELRLSKAVTLLRDPDAKVINVAEQSGFNHLGLFNTCFKRRFGTSPGRWRKMRVEIGTQAADLPGRELTCPFHSNGLCHWPGPADNLGPAAPDASQTRRADFPVVLVAPELNGKTVKGQTAINGKQVSNLLYRRFPIGRAVASAAALEAAKRLRVGNPRYSRFGNLRYGAVVTLNKYMRESVGRRPGEGVVHGPNACAKRPAPTRARRL